MNTKAQNIPSAFTLVGKINAQKGKIVLFSNRFDFFYPGSKDHYEAKVINGNFIIKDSVYYPYPFMIFFENELGKREYLSGAFFIDPGIQHIVCHKDLL